MIQMILRQNIFLEELAIVLINGILQKDELKVIDCFKQSIDFIAMEPTRKSFEGRWILVTTNRNLYDSRIEADNILANFKHQPHHISKSINNNPSPKQTVTNHFSTYKTTLTQVMTTANTSKMITSLPN